MDPVESRSITIQTGVSAVKTLSISCRVFARSLACNEVLINNSWLPLIFNGSLLHGTLLDEDWGVGGRGVREERTNLKILNYSYQRFMVYWQMGVVGRRDGQCGNWSSATVLLEIAPCYFTPGVGNPGGQFLIQLVQFDVRYVTVTTVLILSLRSCRWKIQRGA